MPAEDFIGFFGRLSDYQFAVDNKCDPVLDPTNGSNGRMVTVPKGTTLPIADGLPHCTPFSHGTTESWDVT